MATQKASGHYLNVNGRETPTQETQAKNLEQIKKILEEIRIAEEHDDADVELKQGELLILLHKAKLDQERMEKGELEHNKKTAREDFRYYIEGLENYQKELEKDRKDDKEELARLRKSIEEDLESCMKIWTKLHSEVASLQEQKTNLEKEKVEIQEEKKNIQDQRSKLEEEEKELTGQKSEDHITSRLSQIREMKQELSTKEQKLLAREDNILNELATVSAAFLSKM